MNQNEEESFKLMMKILSEKSEYSTSGFSELQYQLIFSKLLKWPSKFLFPVLETLRMMMLHPSFEKYLICHINVIMIILKTGLTKDQPINQMLTLRFISNSFQWESLRHSLIDYNDQIMNEISDCVKVTVTHKALSIVILNYSILHLNQKTEKKLKKISLLYELLNIATDSEILFNGLVALGNIVWEDQQSKESIIHLNMKPIIEKHSQSTTIKISECANDILSLLNK